MNTILITGINGFLGSHLAKQLSGDYNIIGLENSVKNLFRLKSYTFKIYSSNDEIEKIFIENKLFAIIHAATIYRTGTESINNLILTNILLPVRLFELANQFKVKIFLNTDSFFNNYKYNYSYLPDYTLSKKQVLEWLKLLKGNCKLVNMKIYHMYGPNDSLNKFIYKTISRLKRNKIYLNTTLGEQTRDFIYISDVVSAFKVVLQKIKLLEMVVEYDVGTGKATSIKEILLEIKDCTKSTTELRFGGLNYRTNEIMKSKANIKALCELGWTSKIKISEGIRLTYNSMRNDI